MFFWTKLVLFRLNFDGSTSGGFSGCFLVVGVARFGETMLARDMVASSIITSSRDSASSMVQLSRLGNCRTLVRM